MVRTDEELASFRWPVAFDRDIAAPASAVWDAISMPGNLEPCHPFCETNIVHRWPGPDALDEIHYLSGWKYERHFQKWIEGVGYDIEVGRPGKEMHYVKWRIRPVGDERANLSITIYPGGLQHLPVLIRWLPHYFVLRPRLTHYLGSVVHGYEWYVTKGEPVPRDQWGRHPWFSAKAAA